MESQSSLFRTNSRYDDWRSIYPWFVWKEDEWNTGLKNKSCFQEYSLSLGLTDSQARLVNRLRASCINLKDYFVILQFIIPRSAGHSLSGCCRRRYFRFALCWRKRRGIWQIFKHNHEASKKSESHLLVIGLFQMIYIWLIKNLLDLSGYFVWLLASRSGRVV